MASYIVEELEPMQPHLGTCFNCQQVLDRTFYLVTKIRAGMTLRRRYCVACWDGGFISE